jgi:GT2 family glycosyltransferase
VRKSSTLSPLLSVVIVNHRSWSTTARLVRQLRRSSSVRQGTAEIMIVDNHSPPHPLVARLRRSSGVSLRRWGRNRGFARAVNEGCRLSRGRWFLLLNPDVSVSAGWMEKVQAVAEEIVQADPRAGIVGFGLRHDDGTRQHSTGPFPSLAGTLTRLFLPRALRKYHVCPPARREVVPWVTGCCLLVRSDCFRELGGLDADFFLYYEDVDLCRRARAQGWTVWHEPAVRLTHHQPLHRRTVPSLLRLVTRHALLTYGGKHWPSWQVRLLARIVQCEGWLRQMGALLRGDRQSANQFAEMRAFAADLARGRRLRARQRLERVLRRQEQADGH